MNIIKGEGDLEKFGSAVNARLSEFFDGHIVVGFIAGQDLPVILSVLQNPKTSLGLESLLLDALSHVKNLRAHGG